MVSRVETRCADKELEIVRHAHKTALIATKEAQQSAAKAEEEANDYIISKLAELEGETKQKLMKEMECNDKDRHQKLEQMKALLSTEIERQKNEIATLKTKVIAEKFEHNADKSKARLEIMQINELMERGQVHLVLNDVVSSVLLQEEQGKVREMSSRENDSHTHYMTASSGKMAQLGNMGDVRSLRISMGMSPLSEPLDDSEGGLYDMSGSIFKETTKRKPDAGERKHIRLI